MKNCIVLFTDDPEYWDDEEKKPLHHYSGSFLNMNTVFYIKSFIDDVFEITTDIDKAMKFADDNLCTRCMERIIETKNPWTIAVWSYEGKKMVAQCVHYPNTHWSRNGNLQPSLMKRSVSEFWKNKK